ncbi:MAG: aminotransferase class V-fold PLP-dependent enzyme [Candidatus Eremiobacteraeota bacterium]|nr:aminotransferase class V-fold PLP-dependent enzyme [Candidatus Eremiobacteraeota bacterium]
MKTPLDRALFPVTEHFNYLNHAAVGILPIPVRDAIIEFVDAHATTGIVGVWPYDLRLTEYRSEIARFIGADAEEIAVLRNSADGANAIAAGLRWEPGDEIILGDNEFPSNAYPWLACRDLGAKVRLIETERERLTPDVLRKHISKRTRVVTVSWVSFMDGYRHDLAGLAEVAHGHGALLCVDVMQSLGAFPLDVRSTGVDAVYAGGAKWLMALQGVSFLYVRKALIDRLRLAAPGWRSAANLWDFLNYEQAPVNDASRFEGGTVNFVGALSLAKAIEVLAAPGRRIAEHVLELTDRLCDGLQRMGAEIASDRSPETSSAIVTFKLPQHDPIELGRILQKEKIITTYRTNGVRVSPHGYNTEREIDDLLTAVSEATPLAAAT